MKPQSVARPAMVANDPGLGRFETKTAASAEA
jgi:hypothetical protein